MAEHNQFGKKGEEEAIKLLRSKGFSILAVNWRYMKQEIDIIVENKEAIVFVEVKARGTDLFGRPQDFVTRAQQKRIINAADAWLIERNCIKEARFDVIAVLKNGNKLDLIHIEEAFSAIG